MLQLVMSCPTNADRDGQERDLGLHYQELAAKFGAPVYKRIDAKADLAQKKYWQIFHRKTYTRPIQKIL